MAVAPISVKIIGSGTLSSTDCFSRSAEDTFIKTISKSSEILPCVKKKNCNPSVDVQLKFCNNNGRKKRSTENTVSLTLNVVIPDGILNLSYFMRTGTGIVYNV